MRATAGGALHLVDSESLRDLATYVRRARRLDPDGAARLSGHGPVLAVYVSPLHGAGLPDVLGLRTFALHERSDVDVVVDLAALTDRLARSTHAVVLPLPLVPASGAAWAGVSPPRHGWRFLGALPSAVLAEVAGAGIAEVAAGVPDLAGGPAVARLRARVWGRPVRLPEAFPAAPDLPAGAAFAADGLGFLDEAQVEVFAAGRWLRVSTRRGHVLARRPLLG